jgi:CheY-specific phosphatase CheX
MDETVISDLINTCWTETTHLPIQSTDVGKVTCGGNLYIASVVFSGKSQGSMTIAMGKPLAVEVAASMFDCEVDSVGYDDIKDCIGELVNVLAGYIKNDFLGDSELAKPLVMEGSDAILTILGSDLVFQRVFSSGNNEQVMIQICQTD